MSQGWRCVEVWYGVSIALLLRSASKPAAQVPALSGCIVVATGFPIGRLGALPQQRGLERERF